MIKFYHRANSLRNLVTFYKQAYWTDFKLAQILKVNILQTKLRIEHFKDLYSLNLRKGRSKPEIQIIGNKRTC